MNKQISFFGFPFCSSPEDLAAATSAGHKNVAVECLCGSRFTTSVQNAALILGGSECRCNKYERSAWLLTTTEEEFISNMADLGLNKRML